MVPLEHPLWGRLYAAGVLAGAVALLVTAAFLDPGDRTIGTHEQLGLGACGFYVVTGIPCPTCGMTTAYAYTVRGRLLRALWAQPAGLVLAIATAATGIAAAVAVVTGRRPSVNWYRVNPLRCIWAATLVLVLAWIFKVIVSVRERPFPAP